MSKQVKQNRYSGPDFVEYGVLSALFDMIPESGVGLVAPNAQTAFDLAKKFLTDLVGTKRMKSVLLPRRPSRISNATHRRLIQNFDETGSSYHSGNATLLQYIVDHCEEKGVGYNLCWLPPHKAPITQGQGAYMIEKAAEGSIIDLLQRRDAAISSLLASLEHLSREQQFAIITSFMDVRRLEEMAKFQDRPKERKKLKKVEAKMKKYVKGFEGFEFE